MGATPFVTVAKGDTVDAAFDAAVQDAYYWCGHQGYTGSIAEKHSYMLFDGVYDLAEAEEIADDMIEVDDDRIADKWGPAGALRLKDGSFLFFGWASS